jgi:hypothetical protein
MNDINQYGLDVIAVTDLESALTAVRMIVEQGEGVKVPPDYKPHTHFCIFTTIREEVGNMKEAGIDPVRPVVPNPMTLWQPDVASEDEISRITNPDTLAVAQLLNDCYEVMLLLLLYLYSDHVKTKEQTEALMNAAFFPFMTMFIRPLAEILIELPAYQEDKPPGELTNAGAGFELTGDVVLFPRSKRDLGSLPGAPRHAGRRL